MALDIGTRRAKITHTNRYDRRMKPVTSQPSPNDTLSNSMDKQCKHPRVEIVAREEDSEFVECKECGEVFEASEFKDMAIEESAAGAES